MKFVKFLLCATFVSSVVAYSLQAGVLMVSVTVSSDNPEEKFEQKAFVDKDRMRVELSGDDVDQIIIFRKDKDVFWFIDNKDQTYFEMTREDLREMKAQVDEAMKEFEAQMKDLPPEQRQMMETMMKGKMPEKAPEMTYKKVASGEKVNQWTCDQYEGFLEGEKKMEMWTTDWKKLGLKPEDFQVMQDMADFFGEFVEDQASFLQVGAESPEMIADKSQFAGLPVKVIDYSEGSEAHTTQLIEVKEQDFASSLFELPAGLKKKDMGTK